VTLYGGTCPCCRGRFKARAPAGLEPGSPFGETLRAFVLYLRSVQIIPLARLCDLLHDLLGLDISEGALVGILKGSAPAFAEQTRLIKARLLSGTALGSDETGLRVGKANFWQWIFHHRDSAVFVVDPHRSRQVVARFLGDFRPDFWVSDRLGSQAGWARRGHQVCLAHLIRDAQYAIDAGDAVFAPGLKGLFKRACAIGRRRDRLADSTLKLYKADLERRLSRLLALNPLAASGKKLQRAIKKWRQCLFVFMENRDLEPTTTAPSAACGRARSIARSPTASAQPGRPPTTPTSDPSSRPQDAAASAPSKPSASPSPNCRCRSPPEQLHPYRVRRA